jgi:hypothetical protein
MDICFATPEWSGCVFGVSVLKPTDCFVDVSWLSIDITPSCEEIEGIVTPSIIIEIVPPDAEFASASTDAVLLSCSPIPGEENTYLCHHLPGSPGDVLDINVSFMDGMTRSATVEYPSCDGPVDFVDPFALAQVGCQGESEYYAVIDTFITDEIAIWSLEGVEPPLDCGPADPPRPGRFYCNFAIMDWYTTLTFCVEIVGRPGEICETFAEEDFGAMLPPSCSESDDDDGPDDDGGDDDSMCSPYNETDCTTIYSNECIWENGICTDRP